MMKPYFIYSVTALRDDSTQLMIDIESNEFSYNAYLYNSVTQTVKRLFMTAQKADITLEDFTHKVLATYNTQYHTN